MVESVQKNSFKAWCLAARPKTLAAGSVPVLVASALAARLGCFQWLPAVLCLLFALLAQVASNFANDYFDFVKKTDNEDRLGPARAVASGWIDPYRMLIGLAVTITLACLFGLGLIHYGGWEMVLVGAFSVVCLLAYTAGPWPLAYHGLGDLFVLVFFGFVAVVFTFYVQAGTVHPAAFVLGAVVGLQAVNILVLNNYRDRDTDKASGKKTTIVLFGEPFGRWFYLTNGVLACVLSLLLCPLSVAAALLPWLFLWPHLVTWRKLVAIRQGRELNALLGKTARNLLWLGLLLSIGLMLS